MHLYYNSYVYIVYGEVYSLSMISSATAAISSLPRDSAVNLRFEISAAYEVVSDCVGILPIFLYDEPEQIRGFSIGRNVARAALRTPLKCIFIFGICKRTSAILHSYWRKSETEKPTRSTCIII